MRLRPLHHRRPALRSDDGFALIEVMIAAFVLAVGTLGLVGAFNSSRKLTLLSERRTAMAHRAQLEIERLQTEPYKQLAMISAPSHSSEKTNPDYYITEGSPSSYQYGEKAEEAESLVTAAVAKECTSTTESECGLVSASPSSRPCSKYVGACEWADGLVSGAVYDFVTWHTDKNCGEKCPAKENYKRITVVVTAKVPSGNHEPVPVRVSTLVAEPSS
jgi:prepilin-type N-terminal cleavage/methylation domain-containing protein